jgi:glycosyltransferase involved in cell wall biosynthesis
MNILILTREYKHQLLPVCGGTGTFNATLAKELVKKGHTVHLFGVSKTDIEFEDHGVKVKFEKNLFKKNYFYNLLRSISGKISCLEKLHYYIHRLEKKEIAKKLYNYIHKNNLSIDIIETHDFEGVSLYLKDSIPYVVRCHGSYSILGNYFGYKVEKGRLHCEQEAFKKAKNIIAISEFSNKANTELFGTMNHKLIYNGVDTDQFEINKQTKIIQKSIFYFGNTSMEKGADVAISIFVKILETEPEASLHYLGKETTYKKDILKIINQHNLEEKVCFYGIQQPKEVLEILSKAHVVIFPSKGENFSLAILETMSLAKPIVCSNIDSFKEVIQDKHNGYICKTESEYINTILTLINNSNLSTLVGKNARATVEKDFSLKKMINETEKYYLQIQIEHLGIGS